MPTIKNLEELSSEERARAVFSQRILALGQASSADIAAKVVVHRALGCDRDLALICMTELCRRRSLGEDFDFETFIDDEVKKIPKLQNLNSILTGFLKIKK